MNRNEKESPKIPGEEEYEKAISLINSGNKKEAIPLFQKSANLNCPPSFLYLYLLENDHVSEKWRFKAEPKFNWYQSKAQDGKPDSLFNLGYCYYHGIGTKMDIEKAMELFTNAAEQGYACAQYYLGIFYEYGFVVPKDMTKAFKLFSKAAEQGHASAQLQIIECYKGGKGVAKDINKTIELYNTAIERGLVQRLNLSFINIDVQVVADALEIYNSIEQLDISENKIGDKEAQIIANALKVDRFTAKEIELTNISNIEQALKMKKVLLYLDISSRIFLLFVKSKDNKIGDEGFNAIIEMLKVNNSLQELNISGNEFRDVSKLGDALKYNKSLTELRISRTKSTAKELRKALQYNICLLQIGKEEFETPFQTEIIMGLIKRNEEIQTILSERIFKCKNAHLSLLDYKILERVNVAVIFKNVWKLHQTQQTGKTYEEYLRKYWKLISLNAFSKYFLFILGVCKLNQIPPSRSHLLGIPKEILDYIGSFLNPKDFLIDSKETCQVLKTEIQELKKQLEKQSIQLENLQAENRELKEQLPNKRKKTVNELENQNDQNKTRKRKK